MVLGVLWCFVCGGTHTVCGLWYILFVGSWRMGHGVWCMDLGVFGVHGKSCTSYVFMCCKAYGVWCVYRTYGVSKRSGVRYVYVWCIIMYVYGMFDA